MRKTKYFEKKMENRYQFRERLCASVIDGFSRGQTEACLEAFDLWSRAIRWKIRQVRHMLTEELGRYEQGLHYC